MAYGPGPGRDPGAGAYGPGGAIPGAGRGIASGWDMGAGYGWSRADVAKMGGTIAGELGKDKSVEHAAKIADTFNNRANQNRNAPATGLGTFPNKGFDAFDPRGIAAHSQYNSNINTPKTQGGYLANKDVERALASDRGYARASPATRAVADAVRQAIEGVYGTGALRGSARGATSYQNQAVTDRWGTSTAQKGIANKIEAGQALPNGSFQAHGHTFTGSRTAGFNPENPFTPSTYYEGAPPTPWGDPSAVPGYGGWQGIGAPLTNYPDISMARAYDQPNWSLADLAPDVTQPPAPDWGAALTDRPGRGPVTDPYGFSTLDVGMPSAQISGLPGTSQAAAQGGLMSAQAAPVGGGYGIGAFGPNAFGALDQPAPPDWGMDQGQFGDRGPSGPYSFSGLQTASMEPSMAVYDGGPWGYGQQPDYSAITAGILHDQPAPPISDILNDAFPSSPLAGLSPIGLGVAGVGYNPSAVAAAAPIGAPSMRGMDFGQMTRGIVGYEDKPVTTTTQVPNPAYADWQEAFNNPKATTQQMYADDLADKLGRPTSFIGDVMNQAPMARGPAPSRTIDRTTTTTQRSPVYGDVPAVGARPSSATLSAPANDYGTYPGGNWGGYATAGTGMLSGLDPNIGISGVTGSIGTGFGDPVGYGGGGGIGGSLGGLGGGFAGALGGGYGPSGQPLGGSENQGGAGYSAGYGGNFGGSQGSDPSGRGGLY